MKSTRRLLAGGFAVAALAAVTAGTPASAGPTDPKITATVTAVRGTETCKFLWSASNLKTQTYYIGALIIGVDKTTTNFNDLVYASPAVLVESISGYTFLTTEIDNAVGTFAKSQTAGVKKFTAVLVESSTTTILARDVTITNRCN